jgi:hypothetical protein
VVRTVVVSTATPAAAAPASATSAAATYMTSWIISSASATDYFLHLFIIDGLKDEKIGIFHSHCTPPDFALVQLVLCNLCIYLILEALYKVNVNLSYRFVASLAS